MSDQDYYKILGVGRDASIEAIKKAYHRLALKYHPDKNPGNAKLAAARFREIKEAYEILGDESRRAQYDNTWRVSAGEASEQRKARWVRMSPEEMGRFRFKAASSYTADFLLFACICLFVQLCLIAMGLKLPDVHSYLRVVLESKSSIGNPLILAAQNTAILYIFMRVFSEGRLFLTPHLADLFEGKTVRSRNDKSGLFWSYPTTRWPSKTERVVCTDCGLGMTSKLGGPCHCGGRYVDITVMKRIVE